MFVVLKYINIRRNIIVDEFNCNICKCQNGIITKCDQNFDCNNFDCDQSYGHELRCCKQYNWTSILI